MRLPGRALDEGADVTPSAKWEWGLESEKLSGLCWHEFLLHRNLAQREFDSKDPTPDNWLDEMEETSFKGINDKCHLHISSGVLYIRKYSWGKIPVQNTSMPPSFTGS